MAFSQPPTPLLNTRTLFPLILASHPCSLPSSQVRAMPAERFSLSLLPTWCPQPWPARRRCLRESAERSRPALGLQRGRVQRCACQLWLARGPSGGQGPHGPSHFSPHRFCSARGTLVFLRKGARPGKGMAGGACRVSLLSPQLSFPHLPAPELASRIFF